jgi:hypothetical protein
MATQRPRKPYVPITTVAAEALAKTGHSLNEVANGQVQKMGHTDVWDMGQEWVGRELANFSYRESLWDKSIRVVFFWLASNGTGMPGFTLSLHPPLTKEEIERSAETHMILLNLTRRISTHGNN